MTDIHELWQEVWDETVQAELEHERSAGWAPEQFYTSGRASKDFPHKEDPRWWASKGPGFVKSWVAWRNACGLDIWTTPTGEPAIELPVVANQGDLEVLSVIDRVMVDKDGNLYVIDLKSGSMSPAWPRQLALNNLGLNQQFGVRARYGGFWSARKGGVDPMFDLRIYDEDWMWEQVRMAREIRDQQLYVAQPTNLCNSSCSVRDYCKAVGGSLSHTVPHPIFLDLVQP